MQNKIKKAIQKVVEELGLSEIGLTVEHPTELSHGDYSTNIAMVYAQKENKNPRELAETFKEKLEGTIDEVETIEIAGPGFINFRLKRDFLSQSVENIVRAGDRFGTNEKLLGQKILIEYTDPNPFKPLHIGHLMANTVGEAVSRVIVAEGATLKRANYQGDIGMHVAKAIWGMIQLKAEMPVEDDNLKKKVTFLGKAYVHGATSFEENENLQTEIKQINIQLYKKNNEELNNLYTMGREWSLEQFEELYKKLGTTFDFYFFESDVYETGRELVKKHLGTLFEESEGATIFKGEKFGLHTRVFLNSQGLPTYEAKELGLHEAKKVAWDFDESIVVTANEQKGVFEVGLKAFEQIDPVYAGHVQHVTHGMMLGSDGKKMSSRKGKVIAADDLISEVEQAVNVKIADRDLTPEEKKTVAEKVAIAAIKYIVLKQAPGRDIVFNLDQATSLDGDSGPYLQYTAVRAQSVLAKAHGAGIGMGNEHAPENPYTLEKLLYYFPEIVARAGDVYEPHYITNYLIEIASAFNAFYAQEKIADPNDEFARYKVQLTQAVRIVLENGLNMLGINVPEKM